MLYRRRHARRRSTSREMFLKQLSCESLPHLRVRQSSEMISCHFCLDCEFGFQSS